MIKKSVLVFLFLVFFVNSALAQTPQQEPKQEFFKARVIAILKQGRENVDGYKNYYQKLKVQIESGSKNGQTVNVDNGGQTQITQNQLVKNGQEIVISKITYPNGQEKYSVYDFYRINSLIVFIVIFLAAIMIVAGLKGIGSISGMLISLGVILFYIVPNILKGQDPLTVTIIGSVFIILVTTYLAHGISKKTTIALFSTLISLVFAAFFAIMAMHFNNITGVGNEDYANLMVGPTSRINIQGLFLSAVIIGTLGALNDVTTTQSATIEEFKKTEPKLKFEGLFEKGMIVGREHISSLINTLILAYVGSAFAVFIFFVLNPAKLPYWVILNNEIIADEVVKIVAGSIGLLLSVPIVTFIASIVYGEFKN